MAKAKAKAVKPSKKTASKTVTKKEPVSSARAPLRKKSVKALSDSIRAGKSARMNRYIKIAQESRKFITAENQKHNVTLWQIRKAEREEAERIKAEKDAEEAKIRAAKEAEEARVKAETEAREKAEKDKAEAIKNAKAEALRRAREAIEGTGFSKEIGRVDLTIEPEDE